MDMSNPPMHNIGFDPNDLPPRSKPFQLFYFSPQSLEGVVNHPDGIFPVSLPTNTYLIIHALTVLSLYLLLCVKYFSCRTKQLLALPILLGLLAMPIFFTASSHLIHLICALTTSCYVMRFIDIYYLKPWTGIRSYYNGQHSSHQVRSQPSTAGSESKEGEECEESSDAHEWLMWDKERLRTELWASVRKLPNVSHGASEPRGVAVATIVPYALVYIIVGDALLLSITDARITDLDRLSPTARQILLATVGGATIALMMLYFFYLILFGWVIVTRQQIIYPSEWTMTSHRFPLFATDPADFWSQWHTLFKFVWVDFAYFPLRRLAQRFMDSSRTGSRALSRALELALPVLGVFFLSGVSHGFCIWAAWRAPPSSQMNYFLVQGLAVIVTKGFQQSSPGRRWSRVYHSQSERRRKWIDRAGMIAMVVFHILTAPPFIEPYARHEVWLGHRSRSVLWHLFVKHWA